MNALLAATHDQPADASSLPSQLLTIEVLQRPLDFAQYTSAGFGELCDRLGVTQSMGATGVCWDNAAAESFFGTLKRELANRRRWATRADARRDLIRWIEGWFNTRRLHTTIDYNTPVEIEDRYYRRGDGIAA